MRPTYPLETSPARAWKWVNGLCKRIEDHNTALRNNNAKWNEFYPELTVGNSPDNEGYPFIVWQSWDDKKKVAELVHREQRDADYPEFDSRVDEGFADEYTTCSDCLNVVRTSPDSYFWTPDYIDTEDGTLCRTCWEADPDVVINAYKNENRAVPDSFDPTEHGWAKVNVDQYQSGMHPGMNDDPAKVLAVLHNRPHIETLLKSYPSQFYTEWDVYVPDESLDDARARLGITVETEDR